MDERKIPKFESEIPAEGKPEKPTEEVEQWTEKNQQGLEELERTTFARDTNDLETVRTENDLPTEGPGIEGPARGDLGDILADAENKGLVFQMDEIEDTPEFREKVNAANARRSDLKGEELYRAADEELARRNSTSEGNEPKIVNNSTEAPETTAEHNTPDNEGPTEADDNLAKEKLAQVIETTLEQMTPREKLHIAIESGNAEKKDHASRSVFKEARNDENWPVAIEMIQYAKPGDARNGRIRVLKKEMEAAGQTYTGPAESTPNQQEGTVEKMTPQQKLEKAIESGNAEKKDHASYPIFKEARNDENWPVAIEMIQYAKPGDARNGRIRVLKKEMEAAGQTYTGPAES